MRLNVSLNVFEFGVLLLPLYQWLDVVGPVDYINTHSQELAPSLGAPPNVVAKAPTVNWHYISSAGDLQPVQATSGALHLPTKTFETAPPLDYLLIPGPDPALILNNATISFLKSQFPKIKGLLTVCTGSIVLSQTGLLDGLHVAGNKVAIKKLAQNGGLNRNVKWIGDKRYVRDGKVWSAAGITAGLDLGAEFARVMFDKELVRIVGDVAEYHQNPAYPDRFARILEGVKLD